MANLPELLKTLVESNGSDLHIATNTPPQMRVHGHLERIAGNTDMTPAETKQLVYSVLTDSQKKRFEESLELDFSFGIKAIDEGMITLRGSGLRKVKDGVTTIEEVVRETVK